MKDATIVLANFGGKRDPAPLFSIVLTAYLLLTIACSPFAQNRRQIFEAKNADQIVNDMKRWIGLTDEQGRKVRPIIEEQVKKRNELNKKYQGQGRESMDSLKYGLQDLRISTEKQLQYFLTNEQMIEYGRMQQEEDQKMSRGEMPGNEGQKGQRDRGPRPGNL